MAAASFATGQGANAIARVSRHVSSVTRTVTATSTWCRQRAASALAIVAAETSVSPRSATRRSRSPSRTARPRRAAHGESGQKPRRRDSRATRRSSVVAPARGAARTSTVRSLLPGSSRTARIAPSGSSASRRSPIVRTARAWTVPESRGLDLGSSLQIAARVCRQEQRGPPSAGRPREVIERAGVQSVRTEKARHGIDDGVRTARGFAQHVVVLVHLDAASLVQGNVIDERHDVRVPETRQASAAREPAGGLSGGERARDGGGRRIRGEIEPRALTQADESIGEPHRRSALTRVSLSCKNSTDSWRRRRARVKTACSSDRLPHARRRRRVVRHAPGAKKVHHVQCRRECCDFSLPASRTARRSWSYSTACRRGCASISTRSRATFAGGRAATDAAGAWSIESDTAEDPVRRTQGRDARRPGRDAHPQP